MKKLIAIILALVMALAMTSVAFAEEQKGSITLKDVAVKLNTETNEYETIAEYCVYKMFDLASYNAANKRYAYTLAEGWGDFLNYAPNGDEGDKVSNYLVLNENKVNVEWVEKVVGEDRAPRAAELAKLALAYAKSKNLTSISADGLNQETVVPAEGKNTATITFTNLDLGYYLVDSTMGALCGLTTTNPDVNMAAKNAPPTINKQTQEASLGSDGATWDVVNDASIGETINFDITVTVHAGAEKYILHDKMDAGLEFTKMLSLNHHVSGGASHTLAVNDDYTLNMDPTDDCSFHVEFTDSFCNHVGTGDRIVMLYTGKLNKDAVIGDEGNKNEAWLTFGENSKHSTEHVTTTTQTWAFDLVKVDSERNLLKGATFTLYGSEKGNDEIKVVAVEKDGKIVYRKALSNETAATGSQNADDEMTGPIVVADGVVRISGLDSGTYYLEENTPPTEGGYNVLATRKKFTIDEKNIEATINDTTGKAEIGTGVQVENKSGTILPQTGGIGTLLFTVLGGSTALGTGVVLVTKKRMSKIEDDED